MKLLSTTFKSLHVQIFHQNPLNGEKKSHFNYKSFLGEQDQKGLRSFWNGWLHVENNAHQCD